MVRHVFMTGAISPAPRGMVEAADPAHLVASSRLPPPHLARLEATVGGAVELPAIATRADQDLLAAQGAKEEAAARAVREVATDRDVAITRWTRSASGANMLPQSCSGTVWGAAPSLNCQVHRSAPRLVYRYAGH